MGIFDKFTDKLGRWFGFSDDDEEREIEPKKAETSTPPLNENEEPPKKDFTATNILNFSTATLNKENSSANSGKFINSEIKTVNPKKFEDARVISDHLCDKVAIVINFEETDSAIAAKILDYVSGTAHAVKGNVKRVGKKVFIAAPNNVKIENYDEEQKSKGTFLD